MYFHDSDVDGDALSVVTTLVQPAANGSVLVNANGIKDIRGDACALRLSYKVENVGEGDASNFRSRVKKGAASLHSKQISLLKGKNTQNVAGKIYLPNGEHTLIGHVDYSDKVNELSELNNLKRVQVTVTNCGDNRQIQ